MVLALALIAILIFGTGAQAGSVAMVNVEAPIYPQGARNAAAQDYMNRYPDVAAVYGNGRNGGPWTHYVNYGNAEGRVWNGYLDIAILTYCEDKAAITGNNCAHFPNGARIGAISWESSVKVHNSEVFSYLSASNGQPLMSTYQQGQGARIKTITLPDPIVLAPGSFIFLYAEGWGDYNAGGFEAQIALYLLD